MSRTVVASSAAPPAVGAYSQAIAYNGILYVSGCIGLDTEGKFTSETVEGQAKQVMENMGAILKAGNSDFASVLKCTILLVDINDFAKVNDVYKEYFPSNPPARACFAVSALPKGSLVEIECIAAVKETTETDLAAKRALSDDGADGEERNVKKAKE